MRLYDFMEKIDSQARQLEMIGIKGDTMFTSIKQSIEKQIFKTVTTDMSEDEVKVMNSFHDLDAFKKALPRFRELAASGISHDEISETLAKEFVK